MNPESNNNSQKNNVNQNVSKVETIDLNVKPNVNVQTTNNNSETPATKSSNGVLIIVFLIIGLFILLLPLIDSYVKNIDMTGNTNNKQTNEENSNLHNDLIQIGKDSFMTLSNIKFYNFTKKSNNTINFNFIASEKITDVSNLNIFIEFYDNAENLIYRTKFNDFKKIENSVVGSYDLKVTDKVYSNSNYAKAFVIDSEVLSEAPETKLNCVSDKKDLDVNLNYEIEFYFKLDELTRYDVSKNILYESQEESENLLKYKNDLNQEYNLAVDANAKNIVKEDLALSYTIDFNTFDSDSEYVLLFQEGNLKSLIKDTLTDISDDTEDDLKWTCN